MKSQIANEIHAQAKCLSNHSQHPGNATGNAPGPQHPQTHPTVSPTEGDRPHTQRAVSLHVHSSDSTFD